MKEKINVGYIGLGRRGRGMLKACFSQMNDVNVKTICDVSEERIEMGKQIVLEKGGYTPASTTDYREILADPEVEAVMIASAWESHAAIAIAAMKAGKPTAMEVGGAYSVCPTFRQK